MSENKNEFVVGRDMFLQGFQSLMNLVHSNAQDKGFYDHQRSVHEFLMLICSEIFEYYENNRSLNGSTQQDKHCPEFLNSEIEMADAVIRIMDYCKSKNYRLPAAIVAKHNFNTTRPHKHGKKF